MGHSTRTMTRQPKSQRNNFNKPYSSSYSNRRDQNGNPNQRNQGEEKEKNLKLIALTEEQEKTNRLKFVYELPQKVKEVKALLKDHSDEDQLIIIQRIRDYHNPELVQTGKPSDQETAKQKFSQFILSLLKYYLALPQPSSHKSLLNHLKELCSRSGSVFASYLKQRLIKIVDSIKLISQSQQQTSSVQVNDTYSQFQELIEQFLMVQRIFIEILQCPENSKLLEAIEQTSGHIYSICGKFLKSESLQIVQVAQNDLEICQCLKKRFNPSLTNIMLKLALFVTKNQKTDKALIECFSDLYSKYVNLLKHTTSAQLQIIEINKIIKSSQSGSKDKKLKSIQIDAMDQNPLSLIQLQNKKPKPLPSFAPLIEEEFLLFRDQKAIKRLKGVDEKELKRKMKKTENHALRELRKDTTVIQIQRDKEMSYKKDQVRKTIYKAGQIKDEI